ncbi:error-prone DNA polymerase [Mariniblastus fucicola]|uniref:Error-prone DNA polymerase n=1 Tax=Mariniblastus fucicola TaxID=980251 RepID=A0A5B9PE66_9BACT|nr:error-prone DNA polymerase [Mariniblastus fucicola]QEG23789.1 Error-prone DNA polymerase [Mariniblastus fucicola]
MHELHCKTNFSFLAGASHADELVHRAIELGYSSLAVTDQNTLAGVVRAYGAIRDVQKHGVIGENSETLEPENQTAKKIKLIIGAEIIFNDALPVVLWATDRKSYANLSRLITVGRRRAPKGECWLKFEDLADHHEGLLAGVIPFLKGDTPKMAHVDATHVSYEWFGCLPKDQPNDAIEAFAKRDLISPRFQYDAFRELFGDRVSLLASLYKGVDDDWRVHQLKELSDRHNLPLSAAGDVLYHVPARMPLHDCLTAVRHRTTIELAGDLRVVNAHRHLHSDEARQRQYAAIPEALENAARIAEQCSFCMSQLRYEYPEELAPAGQTPIDFLRELVRKGSAWRYPDGVPEKVRHAIRHELSLIEELNYEAYFLTVWDLVRYARSRDILCQGRGSAANSAVCYCLGVTSVDPAITDLLFERFISKERDEAPDIDVDFEHERREEVLQYLYNKYGRDRAGLAATVITYRSRSAIRDVGKALGLSLDRVDALAKQVDGYHNVDLADRCEAAGIDPQSESGSRLCYLVNEILGFPRHLSQHVGGMVITQGKLHDLVPIENAAMDDRTVIQWDKNDLEELGLLKVDCLCLGMLTAIRKCFAMVKEHWGCDYSLATIPQDDSTVYDMICEADTVGVFQIESRGQMNMLPRLKPRCFYDLVIEVAIVRPGPIQGNMVHPYLRRRNGEEKAVYPNDEIKAVLERTLGVPIFQEQAMKLAVVAAGFTPGEADRLRRAMGAWRKTGVIEKFQTKLMEGMRKKGLSEEFAGQVFRQIRGFGEYGFPESHAASFALLVYVSCWLKWYYPAAFCASLINSQPMGFYPPAQLVADAQRHDVEVLPVDVNLSDWDCTLERGSNGIDWAMRLGLRMVSGVRGDVVDSILTARETGDFTSVVDFTRRTKLGRATIATLTQADAFGSVNQDRREALWQALGQEKQPVDQPLFSGVDDEDDDAFYLPSLTPQQQVTEDYRSVGLSLRAHPISFHREFLNELGVRTHGSLEDGANDQKVIIGGLVILRQRPATAKGITFVTLEDETGSANVVVMPHIWERNFQVARRSAAWIVHGRLEKKNNVIHVVATRLEGMAARLNGLKLKTRDFR